MIAKIRIILGQVFEVEGNYSQAYNEYTEAEDIYEKLQEGMEDMALWRKLTLGDIIF